MEVSDEESHLVDTILEQAYGRDRPYREYIYMSEPTTCPHCQCEFTFKVREELNQTVFICNYCFKIFYAPKERAA